MANPNDANIIVDGQKVVATLAQSGTVVQDGGAIDATSVIQTDSGLQKVVKVMDVNGGGGGGGEQNIKAYHAPSATLDQTLQVIMPNVDAVTEQGMYNVDYSFDMGDADLKTNALLEVITQEAGGQTLGVIQNILINFNESFVYATRIYADNAWSAWTGKNIPVELAKGLQNSATGTNSVAINSSNTEITASDVVVLGAQPSSTEISNSDILIGNNAKNTNNKSGAITIGYNAYNLNASICIGYQSQASGNSANGIAIGRYARVQGNGLGIAIGGGNSISDRASANADCIQLGRGSNSVAKQFQVYTYPMLDGTNGKIPNERLRITVADTSSTNATIANVEGGRDYTFTNALTALTITAITSSFVEANIYFTADTGIAVTLPQGTNTIGDFTFTAGKSYVISIQNGIAVRGELN